MAATKKAGFGGAALLGKLAAQAPAPAAKDGDTPVIELPRTPELASAAEKLIGAKRQMKQATSTIETVEDTIIQPAKEARRRHCMDKQAFNSSVKITIPAGADPKTEPAVGPITVSWQNRYSEIPIGDKAKLEHHFGDSFEKCFRTQTAISVTEEGMAVLEAGMEDENGLLAKMVEAAGGPEKFAKVFQVKQTLKPTEYLHEEATKDPTMGAAYDKAVADQVLKPTKPSTRI